MQGSTKAIAAVKRVTRPPKRRVERVEGPTTPLKVKKLQRPTTPQHAMAGLKGPVAFSMVGCVATAATAASELTNRSTA